MAFDGVMLKAVTRELQEHLVQARIDRILMPEETEIHLVLRQPGQNYRLLLCAHPEKARVHFTWKSKPNPVSPPLFCLVLRKHLEGGRITAIEQPGLERVLRLHIEAYNELGDRVNRLLICEIMGKHSNLLLIDPESNQIIDGIRRYSSEVSRYREVLPGRPYLPPPPQEKLALTSLEIEELEKFLFQPPFTRPVWRALFNLIDGLSPLLAREIIWRAGLKEETRLDECGTYEINRLKQALQKIKEAVASHQFLPSLVVKKEVAGEKWSKFLPESASENNRDTFPETFLETAKKSPMAFSIAAFSALPLLQFDPHYYQIHNFSSPSQMLDLCYFLLEKQSQWRKLRQELEKTCDSLLEKAWHKYALRQESLQEVESAEEYKLKGELLMSCLSQVKPGMTEISLPNFYDPEEKPVSISLEPDKTPIQNAQEYFRRYSRARRSLETVKQYLNESEEEIKYLNSVKHSLDLAVSLEDLEEIRAELIEQGCLRAGSQKKSPLRAAQNSRKKKTAAEASSQPAAGSKENFYRFLSSDGYEILAGKNNRQNDYLTMKAARKNDVWLHAKDQPGAHVIIKNSAARRSENLSPPYWGIPPRTLEEAAQIAAYYSSGQQSSYVLVDYTLRQYVKKPSGARPGYVIYENYQTLRVKPALPESTESKEGEGEKGEK